ncbi:hypothetical protein H112_01352 [Trichophyton rubrum D6]|uniref:Uncharacterized protein n=1 Tax=Trichophyton rubrum CBS 288.86 TaxID=1215330 RepID=A0A022WCJ6_TRIRU|nr:hypothetical protein H100_01346 [Trichophyton rubrum MR850]EZF45447.1 hypothetical protein H102_01341 [Trichophyton rubrum CBS 100081]EZF56100.1 hypothetical protein H103_01351 [Trichophyton rubrum CBS 288.86]EZF66791.1 hypothetical protein H104_01331 [Trichophyton rubrum CBS 289.86]EZF88108.1 hypothetical protein H110_01350 [Trichophyton rubrum MR1448]EZF98787.1 hypothetical protein H113_01354 [Trichophyton rubrum MR1459]EZG20487.1 hypothetical protein H107_01402 [Trichophyton rubrum CBS 
MAGHGRPESQEYKAFCSRSMHGTCRTVGWGELASKAAARWLVARLILGLITTIGNTPQRETTGQTQAGGGDDDGGGDGDGEMNASAGFHLAVQDAPDIAGYYSRIFQNSVGNGPYGIKPILDSLMQTRRNQLDDRPG